MKPHHLCAQALGGLATRIYRLSPHKARELEPDFSFLKRETGQCERTANDRLEPLTMLVQSCFLLDQVLREN